MWHRTLPLAVSAVILVSIARLPAQTEHRRDRLEQLQARVAEARDRLRLSEEQVEKLAPILKQQFQAMRKVLAEHGIDLEKRSGRSKRLGLRAARKLGRQLDNIREETLAQLQEFLHPEQIAEYKKLQAEQKKALRQRIRERRGRR